MSRTVISTIDDDGAKVSVTREYITVFELLKQVYEGDIDKDTIFVYDEEEYKYEPNYGAIGGILSIESGNDLFDAIQSCDLLEEIEVRRTYSPNYATFSFTPSIVSQSPIDSKCQCCPVCGGKGFVQAGFYNGVGTTIITSTTGTEKCRSCNGKGWVQ